MKKRKVRVILTILFILILLGVLVFVTFGGSQTARKVSEIKGNEEFVGVKVRLTGKIVPKSLKSHSEYYEFKVTDGKEEITVVYKGVLPNSFQDGADVIADGYVQEDGKFKANSLLVKCPSKYVPKKDT
jgi:cytochrome c-type biogenesis protein CcmE